MIDEKAIRDFKPTEEMIDAAELTFLSMAAAQTIRPVVEGYQRMILTKHQFKIAPRWKEGKRVITDPDHTYLLGEKDWKAYHDECKVEESKAGLKTKGYDYCPLLVAQADQVSAERLLINSFQKITGMSYSDVSMKLDVRKKFLDITLRLMAKYVKKGDILERMKMLRAETPGGMA